MKRLCFDTESNYFKRDAPWIGSVEDHREHMCGRSIRFDCAVVYDEEGDQFHEFNDTQAGDLIAMLATADELISHSGKRHDLLVLENVCGAELVAPIWAITHNDLLDMHSWASLDTLAKKYVPDRILADFKRGYHDRISDADIRWPGTNWGSIKNWQSRENFIAHKLAKARWDVERTYAVFLNLPPLAP